MPSWQSRSLARRVLVNAERWRIDANMLVAIVAVESAWRTHAISSAGAIGLGQLMPGTAASLRVNPHDPAQNLYGAARYLSGLMQRFGSKHYENYVVRVIEEWARLAKSVHIPASAFLPAHGLDIDYWLNGTETPPN